MNHHLKDLGYLLVPQFVSAPRSQALADRLQQHHASAPPVFDKQVPDAPSTYNFLPFVRLLVEKAPQVGLLCGAPVLPTYAYSRCYRHDARLPRHSDRDACEISLSLHLQGDRPWDLWLQAFGQSPARVRLAPGDAVLYLGCQSEHWREPYAGQDYLQVFLHYVLAGGSRAWAFFDREQRA
jgi:hypothetical protein